MRRQRQRVGAQITAGKASEGRVEAYPEWPNLAAMMFDRARLWADRPMLRSHHGGVWHSMKWREFARQAASVARHLRAAGIAAGDRVLIVSENRPEYPIVETALMAIRAVPVPTYVTNTIEDHAHVLRDCGARAAVVSTALLAGRVVQAAKLELLVTMEDFACTGPCVLPWDSLTGDRTGPADIMAEAALIPSGALACLIYTSGTGGTPKGVMLPHRAVLSNCRGAYRLLETIGLRRDVYLSFLPLSHSYEHTAGQFFMAGIGAEIVYSRGAEHLASDMKLVRPTIMTVVPRVLEVIRQRIQQQLVRQPTWKQTLFARAVAVGIARAEGGRLSLADRLLDPLLDRLVRRAVRDRFGGRLRVLVSGGARLDPEVGRFFLGLGLGPIQGYGQTEAGPVIAANPPTAIRVETVGPPLQGVECRIAADGEILVRGDLVMDGYWGQPAETARVIHDGWLHTGDIGVLDPDGYLRITDRKRDMIVLSGGENISPARIEALLADQPEILQAVVFGEGMTGLSGLIVATEGHGDTDVAAAVLRVNKRLSVTERVRRHVLVAPFTLESGELTATQKIRRHVVIANHRGLLQNRA
jgi:long-chain acyl-CoA synthetase